MFIAGIVLSSGISGQLGATPAARIHITYIHMYYIYRHIVSATPATRARCAVASRSSYTIHIFMCMYIDMYTHTCVCVCVSCVFVCVYLYI